MDYYTGKIIIPESEYDDLLEENQRYKQALEKIAYTGDDLNADEYVDFAIKTARRELEQEKNG